MLFLSTLLFSVVLFGGKGHAKIPDFIHPCPLDNNVCILQSTIDAIPEFAKGIPELGVPPLDPFSIEKLTLPLPGLKTTMYNLKVVGLRKIIVDKVESKFRKHKLFTMEFRGNLTLKGTYKAQGQILVMPIDGDGDMKVKMTNSKMKVSINAAIEPDEQGVKHIHVKSYQYAIDYGQAVFNLTNLFKGNPELSRTVLRFINENWRLIADEFGKPIIDVATGIIVRAIEKFFLAVPYQELIDGPTYD